MNNNFPRGSVWNKWDLHVHPPTTKLADGYTTDDGSDVSDKFCDEIEISDVLAFGITDYFSIDGYNSFIEKFKSKFPNSKKKFFFNLELRLNETVNRKLELVNIHLLFNPASLEYVDKFFSKLKLTKTGASGANLTCNELKTTEDFESATTTREFINHAYKDTFGNSVRQEHFLIVTASNNDGIRPEKNVKRKEIISDEIDKFSDVFFGGGQNVDYFLKTDRYEDDTEAKKKPVIAGSDSHSFADLKKYLGNRFTRDYEKDGKNVEEIVTDITWIKANPTFEGLKQITYEPESGSRVFIGPNEPDKKDPFKVIRKIKFNNSDDFPTAIEFNDNLCSIIGSRSSGKSALLAYIAHSIDPKGVEKVKKGPGEGEQFHWDKIDINYSIEWANGKSNAETPGNIVYVRQNYLFEKSNDPSEIKEKIKPVLFKINPEFEIAYLKFNEDVTGFNTNIIEQVDYWFNLSEKINQLEDQLKYLGDKSAIEIQKKEVEVKIQTLRDKNKLSDADLKLYQKLRDRITQLNIRNKEIELELKTLTEVSDTSNYFKLAKINLTPFVNTLPRNLQEKVTPKINKFENDTLISVNKEVLDYKNDITAELNKNGDETKKINTDNADLINKYQKNIELESFVTQLEGYTEKLTKITQLENDRNSNITNRNLSEAQLEMSIKRRFQLIKNLSDNIKRLKPETETRISFGLEYGINKENFNKLSEGVNTRDKTDFIDNRELQLEIIRNNPTKFVNDVYTGTQKINVGSDKRTIVKKTFSFTEDILFTAEMEGDKIGGFSEPTMTSGKRALFALRLVLAESDDTWPLLIDQPEDDLDSRSIYDEIVPFLKDKKKERQIIMVSHNANLVISSDSEQIIVANRHGDDRKNEDGKQFNYLTGSLEFSQEKDKTCIDTLNSQGVCEHACAILDGGKDAFENRKNKYQIR